MVRGLEWHLESSRRQRGYWRAYSEVGTYDINEHPDGAYGVSGRVVVWPLGTLDEAKAAAQADYERRIMSALEPVEAEAEPVAFVIERTLAMGGKHWYLPFLRAGEEVERYRKNSPDEKLVPLYTTPNPHAALKQEGSK